MECVATGLSARAFLIKPDHITRQVAEGRDPFATRRVEVRALDDFAAVGCNPSQCSVNSIDPNMAAGQARERYLYQWPRRRSRALWHRRSSDERCPGLECSNQIRLRKRQPSD